MTIIVVIALLVILFAFLSTVSLLKFIFYYSKAHVPVTTNACTISDIQLSNSTSLITTNCTKNEDAELTLDVSFPVFIIGFMSFISWILFCFFGGVGIPALPIDLITDFISRPKKRTMSEMIEIKEQILLNTKKVKEIAMEVKDYESKGYNKRFFMNKDKRVYNESLSKLRAATYLLDKDYKMYKIQTQLNDELVCHYYLGLILAVIFILLSLSWFIHM